MGPFFFSKYDIPLKPKQFKSLIIFLFSFEIPPSAITFFVVKFWSILNLYNPKKFLFFLNSEEMNNNCTFWTSFNLISFTLWAEPITKKDFLVL